jgi:peptide/nickel transport system substrate-binding protein
MGLTDKDADGFRLGPDGQPITLTIFSIATWFDDTWSLLVEELPKIGFKGNFRGVGWGAQGEVVNNMDWEIIGWQSLTDYANRDWPSRFGGPWASLTPSNSWSRPWYLWLTTGGAQGEQPPAFAQEMWDVAQAAKSAESDEVLTEKIIRLQQLQAEYLIGTDLVQFAHRFRAYASDVGNVQEWFIQMPTIYFHRDQAERDKTLGG